MTSRESPEDVEQRIESDRAALGDTIDAIKDRLSPGQMIDQAMHYVRSEGGDVAGSLGRSFKENPWPLVLTAAGLTWLIVSTSRSGRGDGGDHRTYGAAAFGGRDSAYGGVYAHDDDPGEVDADLERVRLAERGVTRGPGELDEAYQERITAAKGEALDVKREAGERAEAFKERVESRFREARDRAEQARRRARSAMQRGREGVARSAGAVSARAEAAQARTRELYASEPLLFGALGLVAGVVAGALLPTSRTEDRLLGRYRQRVGEELADRARDVAHRAETVVAESTRAAAEAADRTARQESEPLDSDRKEERDSTA